MTCDKMKPHVNQCGFQDRKDRRERDTGRKKEWKKRKLEEQTLRGSLDHLRKREREKSMSLLSTFQMNINRRSCQHKASFLLQDKLLNQSDSKSNCKPANSSLKKVRKTDCLGQFEY